MLNKIKIITLIVLLIIFGLKYFTKEEATEIYSLSYGSSKFNSKHIYYIKSKKLLPFEWLVYLIKYKNKNILIDTGFSDAKHKKKWGLLRHSEIEKLLSKVNLKTSEISDLIITHHHHDHAGNIFKFKNADIYLSENTLVEIKKIYSNYNFNKFKFKTIKNTINLFEVLKIFIVDGHTDGTLSVIFDDNKKLILWPSDNCYLIRNCREKKYVPASVNKAKNKSFIDKYYNFPGIILTHHDPIIKNKFPKFRDNINLIYSN